MIAWVIIDYISALLSQEDKDDQERLCPWETAISMYGLLSQVYL